MKWMILFLFVPVSAIAGSVRENAGGIGSVQISTNGVGPGSARINVPSASVSCTIARVQGTANYPGNVSTSNLAYASPVTIGNLLVVGAIVNANGPTITVSDTKVNTWNKRTQVIETVSGPTTVQIIYAFANSSGADTITVALGASADNGYHIAEYSGLNAYDTEASGVNIAADVTLVTGNFTTLINNELVYAVLGNEASPAISAISFTGNTVFTTRTALTTNVSSTADSIVSAIQTAKTVTANWTTSAKSALDIATFKATCGI